MPASLDPLTSRLTDMLVGEPKSPDAYLALGRQLHAAQQFSEVERLMAHGLHHHPDARDLWNLRGVALRMLRRPAEGLAAIDRALALDPQFIGGLTNRGNLLMDLGRPQDALNTFSDLLSRDPASALLRILCGRALTQLGRGAEAIVMLREAVRLHPGIPETWLDLASLLNESQRNSEALAAIDAGLAVAPENTKLLQAKARLLRLTGLRQQADAFLSDLVERQPQLVWARSHLGDLLAATDPDRAIPHLRRAIALAPDDPDHSFVLLQALSRSVGTDEGARLDEAHALACQAVASGTSSPARSVLLRDIFARLCAFDDLDALGSFRDVGRQWAETGLQGALMGHIAQAGSRADQLELLEQHRIWGRSAEARAQAAPIVHPSARQPGRKFRLGFLSSDLRAHPVGYFALPLFEYLDHDRFEIYVYTFYSGPSDNIQDYVAKHAAAFRSWPEISTRDAAQRIADDQLDVLIELGGLTHMNRPEIMAHRLAPIQASWLGYPHSLGLSTIDRFICDRHNQPTDPALMTETPLLMPRSWVAMSPILTARAPPGADGLPQDRRGHLTYGTANNTYKYTRETLRAWARVTAATPGAHFAFIRPEGGSQVFRRNVEAAFAAEGVDASRLDWHVVRGAHMGFYDEIDISLDTFPLTGGTTTVEALLMGVPVVSLVGEAFYQRLSRSILINTGLGDLCADTPNAFMSIALRLAADTPRRRQLRKGLRSTLTSGPLGQQEVFAREFYDMIHATATAARASPRTDG